MIAAETQRRTPSRVVAALPGLLTVVALAAAILPFVLPAIPVGSDLPKHVLIARMFTSYSDPLYKYAEHFELAPRPVTTSLGTAILAGLMKFASPFTAAKIYLVLSTLAFWFFSRGLAVEVGLPPAAALLLLPVSLNGFVFSGFLPFVGSVAVYPLLLWLLVRPKYGVGRAVEIAALLFVLFEFHLIAWAIGCFSVVLFAIAPAIESLQPLSHGRGSDRSERKVLWADLAGVLLTAALFLFFAGDHAAGGAPAIQYLSPLRQVKALFGYTVVGLSRAASYPFLAGVLLVFGLALAQARRRDTDRRFVVLWVVLTVLGVILPWRVGSGVPVGARTMPFAIIALIGTVRLSPRGWKIATGTVVALTVVLSALNTQAALAVQPGYEEFLSGLNSVPYGSRVLPVLENWGEAGNNQCLPYWGIEDAYTILRGGSNPYVFAYPGLKSGAYLLKYRNPDLSYGYKFDAPANPPYEGVSQHYDYVLLFGNLPRAAEVIGKEMQRCYTNGRLVIFGHPGACEAH